MKVLLAAIAKDEAAYLPEWVFHHLGIGFSAIWVYVNGITDNTREVIDLISIKHPNVKRVEADQIRDDDNEEWSNLLRDSFEENNPMQSKAFADIFIEAKSEGFTHVAYFDVDEFLYLRDGSVEKFISDKKEKILKFKWFQCDGDSSPFMPAIREELKGEKTKQVKYIISTSLDNFVFANTHHVISLNNAEPAHLSGHGNLRPNESHRRYDGWSDDAFIIHRLHRSKDEYLAKVVGGDNIKKGGLGLKLNRKGWIKKEKDVVFFGVNHADKYERNYGLFISECNLKDEIDKAREMVFQRSQEAQRIYFNLLEEVASVSKVMRGTGLPEVSIK